MQLYGALAHLYPLFSPREDYVEEAAGFEVRTQDTPGGTAPILFWGRRAPEGE
ncbi:MAG: hypothetical protein H6741_13670 [Alphaproteobacteria bacterium]|nr:hypothetical protein [Alphaproteobacteria bacterium]